MRFIQNTINHYAILQNEMNSLVLSLLLLLQRHEMLSYIGYVVFLRMVHVICGHVAIIARVFLHHI